NRGLAVPVVDAVGRVDDPRVAGRVDGDPDRPTRHGGPALPIPMVDAVVPGTDRVGAEDPERPIGSHPDVGGRLRGGGPGFAVPVVHAMRGVNDPGVATGIYRDPDRPTGNRSPGGAVPAVDRVVARDGLGAQDPDRAVPPDTDARSQPGADDEAR